MTVKVAIREFEDGEILIVSRLPGPKTGEVLVASSKPLFERENRQVVYYYGMTKKEILAVTKPCRSKKGQVFLKKVQNGTTSKLIPVKRSV